MKLIDIILPLPIDKTFTYRLPDELQAQWEVGKRVLVPFGKSKILTGVILREHPEKQGQSSVTYKDIICYLDDNAAVSREQLRLWEWIAKYYMCSTGEVMRAALPSAMKIESETRICLNPDYEAETRLSPQQTRIFDILSDNKPHNLSSLNKVFGRNVMTAVTRLLEAGAIVTDEDVRDSYKAKTEQYVVFNPELPVNETLDSLHRAPQQYAALIQYFDLTEGETTRVRRSLLPSAAVLALIKKGILMEESVRTSRLAERHATCAPHPLTHEQQQAFDSIRTLFEEKDTVLLHGVTGSGKTDIYIHLIDNVLRKGQTVLYLVPEIALTTQLTERLAAVFGEKMAVWHSRFSDNERYEIYQKIKSQGSDPLLVLGVRSSVFMPFNNLGLVIVDEEHEPSYKQADPAPRYHARSTAMILARLHNAKVLLGSATPAVETYYNAATGKYGLVELKTRYGGVELPKTVIVNTREMYRKHSMQGHLSDALVEKMHRTLYEDEKQIIVFQNLRGYAPYMECKACGYVPKCINCDVSLTLHKRRNILTCHYCGYTITVPQLCPSCQGEALTDRGLGTEKAEDEIQTLFNGSQQSGNEAHYRPVTLARMDYDTTRNKNSYQQIIDDFASRKTDILIGTQMVSKGLDFDNVGLVAVLNCDSIAAQPDYKGTERTFQLLEQVSGRAGRKGNQGEVVIQTSNPDNEVLGFVIAHDYTGFYKQQIEERRLFRYPPFHRLLYVMLSDSDRDKSQHAAEVLRSRLHSIFTHRCSMVVEPVVSRMQNRHIRQIVLKFGATEPIGKAKEILLNEITALSQDRNFASVRVYVDVDP